MSSASQCRRVMAILGTRPEAIKLAPVIRALENAAGVEPVVVATAQHREMLDQVLTLFGIEPEFDLDIISPRQTLTDVTVRALTGLARALERVRPDYVLVQGDTSTTLCGALAAFYQRVPVAHVEAGLRTNDPYSPYPEEINRRLTTQLTHLHFAPTSRARANLCGEGIDPGRIVITGNTAIDALHMVLGAAHRPDRIWKDGRRLVLVTAHRRETWGTGMRGIGRALARIARDDPNVDVVLPIHRNPVVRAAIEPAVRGIGNVRLIEPLAYGEFTRLMASADLVLTDSGGIQEEAPSLGIPVLVLRDTTERPEAVATGVAQLVGTDPDVIVQEVRRLLRDRTAWERMARVANPFGDGRASQRCVAALLHAMDAGPPVREFRGAA